tara:strand:- start:20 stop:340 length:321 start_codon:yes stop_codon:yes gene_type:complete
VKVLVTLYLVGVAVNAMIVFVSSVPVTFPAKRKPMVAFVADDRTAEKIKVLPVTVPVFCSLYAYAVELNVRLSDVTLDRPALIARLLLTSSDAVVRFRRPPKGWMP